jgi:hypothetical protein
MASALHWRDDGVKPVGGKVEIPRFTQESRVRHFTDSSHVAYRFFTQRS